MTKPHLNLSNHPTAILQANGIVPLDAAQAVDNGRKRPAPPTPTTAPSNDVLDLTIDDDNNKPHERRPKRVKTEVRTEVKAETEQPWSRTLGMKQLGGVLDLT